MLGKDESDWSSGKTPDFLSGDKSSILLSDTTSLCRFMLEPIMKINLPSFVRWSKQFNAIMIWVSLAYKPRKCTKTIYEQP